MKEKVLSFLLVICLFVTGIIYPANAVKEEITEIGDCIGEINDEGKVEPDCKLSDSLETTSHIFDYIDRKQFEENGHIARLESLEEFNTYVFANEDGTQTMYMLDENVKYVAEDGNIKEKDITLQKKSNGYGITQSDIDICIPLSLNDGVMIGYKGYNITMVPYNNVRATAILENNSVTYDKVFGENTKLKYTPLLSGIKEEIVLAEYVENAVYSFIVKTNGLSIRHDENGYYLSENDDSEYVFSLGDIVVYDAVGKPDSGTLTVAETENENEYLFTVSANDDFLSNPETVYPVSIDPSWNISDNSPGTGAIEDTTIYSGKPDVATGTWQYDHAGYVDGGYNIGRVLVRASGLYNYVPFMSLTSHQISEAKFCIRESSGTVGQTVRLYAYTGTSWSENTATWNNTSPNAYGTLIDTQSPVNGTFAEYDITNLVKGWKTGTYTASLGFMLKNDDETNSAKEKTFDSSESVTTGRRPYIEMTYSPKISLNYSSKDVLEENSQTLIATTYPNGLPVTWSSSNNSVASVSSSGVVTCYKAGEATITAVVYDTNGLPYLASCNIYVCVPNGVYYIKNMNSNDYLHVKYGNIDDHTDVYQYTKYNNSDSDIFKIRQMWKIYYLGQGRYSIRPMHKLDMGLNVSNGNVDVINIGPGNSNLYNSNKWSISWSQTGYVIKNNGTSNLTMQINGASTSHGSTVIASTYANNANCRWTLSKITSPPVGVYLYNRESINNAPITRMTEVGTYESLSSLQLVAIAFSENANNATFIWHSSDNAIATVDSYGTINGVSAGDALITVGAYLNNIYYSCSYSLTVDKLLIYQTKNTFLYDENGYLPDDLCYGDKDVNALNNILYSIDPTNASDYINLSSSEHEAIWKNMCTTFFATGDLENVISDMIDHFMSGSGLPYSNSVLTEEVFEHEKTQEYIYGFDEQFKEALDFYQGNVLGMKYSAESRENSLIVQYLQENEIFEPVYNSNSDLINGLMICIDSLWGNKVEIVSYALSENNYTCKLHYTLYDHFGLGLNDILDYPLSCFISWYILQHYSAFNSAYKPFLTLIEFDVIISGSIS